MMDKHELRARIDAQDSEWQRNLDTMHARAEAASGDAKVKYREQVATLQKQLDELRIQAAKAWDSADDKWDDASDELQAKWGEWELRAKSALNDLTEPK